MRILNIQLNTEDEAVDFVSKVSKSPEHMDLKHGHCIVDAKSILGVIGMAVRKKVILSVYADDTGNLEDELKNYIVA